MRLSPAFLLCATVLLSACAGGTSQNAAPEATTPPAETATPAPPVESTAEPPPVREEARTPEPTIQVPGTLLGLAAPAINNLFGAPDLVRHEGPAEVRVYRSADANCTLHVFLYVQTGQSERIVDFYQARRDGGRIEGDEVVSCYRALALAHVTS